MVQSLAAMHHIDYESILTNIERMNIVASPIIAKEA
jgi:hypothetical protein